MGTPIYDQLRDSQEIAREVGRMQGRLAERQAILALAKGISSKPTTHLKKLIEELEKRLYAPLTGDDE